MAIPKYRTNNEASLMNDPNFSTCIRRSYCEYISRCYLSSDQLYSTHTLTRHQPHIQSCERRWSKTNISGQAKGFQPKQKFLLEQLFNLFKQVRLEIRVFQMIHPETTGIQQSRWDVLTNAAVKVFDTIVGEIRCFEVADIEFEAIE